MKAYRAMELHLHSFVISALMEVSQLNAQVALTPGIDPCVIQIKRRLFGLQIFSGCFGKEETSLGHIGNRLTFRHLSSPYPSHYTD